MVVECYHAMIPSFAEGGCLLPGIATNYYVLCLHWYDSDIGTCVCVCVSLSGWRCSFPGHVTLPSSEAVATQGDETA